MKKNIFNLLAIILIGIFLFSFISAQESESDTNFFISGCSNEYVSGIPVGTCSLDGAWFCIDKNTLVSTINTEFDCTNNKDGSRTCCPADYTCLEGTCTPREFSCEELKTKDDCENEDDENDCYWLSETCVSNPNQYGCGAYKYEDECNADEFGLGKTGYGTELCGSYTDENMLIYNCHCIWSDESSEQAGCNLEYEIVPEFCVGLDCDTTYSCKKIYNFGNCTNGKQTIDFKAVLYDITTNTANIITDTELKKSYSCNDGTTERNCGEPIIKIPFFSFFNVICVFIAITLIYFGIKEDL